MFASPTEGDGDDWTDMANAFSNDTHMEIRVHRALGRKRIAREFEEYANTTHANSSHGIEYVVYLTLYA